MSGHTSEATIVTVFWKEKERAHFTHVAVALRFYQYTHNHKHD